MGNLADMEKLMTVGQLTEDLGISPDRMRKRIVRLHEQSPDRFPNKSAAADRVLSASEVIALSGNKPEKKSGPSKKNIRTTSTINNHPTPGTAAWVYLPPARQNEQPYTRTWLLIVLLIAPTLASIHNIYTVTQELAGTYAGMLLTVVLGGSALGFVLAGVRRWWTVALAILLILYESMCNMAIIHAGLFSKSGNSSEFLAKFVDTFSTGTHESAFFLSAFTAFFIAAVQYAAVFELNKTATK